ncbi:MAG: peptidoglycan DD-metalloendopeptidase family protein [Bacteroidota bacterium]|nr:peptidoglycan DD-metalloendopeptidase family protein [Bacteroidota bacterium]
MNLELYVAMHRFSIIVIVALCGVALVARASQDEIRKKEKVLDKLRKEINAYEQKIKESEKRERLTLDRLDNYEKQANLIRTLLGDLVDEEERIRAGIETTSDTVGLLGKQLEFLKLHYAKYVTSVYKFGRVYDLETLLSSKSINQLYIRIEYLKRFSEQRHKDLVNILDKKQQLEVQEALLQQKLEEERALITEKKKEERTLAVRTTERRKILKAVRYSKTMYKQELVRKTQAAKELENLISDLIEKERLRKEAEEKRSRERAAERERSRATPPAEEPIFSAESIGGQKGKLPWPVSSGTVVAEFGNQVHPVLKTVTENSGIDISVPVGTPIRCVADGEVAMIHWLPSYGNLIIVTHAGGFHTVYAHLSEINVVEGEDVKAGTVIAKSGDSVSGSLLHFELWKEREKQNPLSWLMRR